MTAPSDAEPLPERAAPGTLRHGVGRIGLVVQEVERWLEEHEYESVRQAQGSMSQRNVAEPAAFERANYMKVLQSWKFDPTGVLMR